MGQRVSFSSWYMGGWIQGDLMFSLASLPLLITSNFSFLLVIVISFSDMCSIEFTQTQDTFRRVEELDTVHLKCLFARNQSVGIEKALLWGVWVTPDHPLTKGKMITNVSWWKGPSSITLPHRAHLSNLLQDSAWVSSTSPTMTNTSSYMHEQLLTVVFLTTFSIWPIFKNLYSH